MLRPFLNCIHYGKMVANYFISLGVTERNHKKTLSRIEPRIPEYEAGMLTTQSLLLVTLILSG